MIRGLFEAHLDVLDLDRSVEFYRAVLGLELALRREVDAAGADAHSRGASRFAFFWVGGQGNAMLGLWERGRDGVRPQHCAFEVGRPDLPGLVAQLEERGVEFRDFFQQRTTVPSVFGFIPAAAIYFDDPDGHVLELLAPLGVPPRPELGVISWDEWTRVVESAGSSSGRASRS
jgi:catechol 2,3-dioxygenase-like lactoylglutathione lyase family enzyme